MISDTLSECSEDLKRYLSDPVFKKVYVGKMRKRIIALLKTMDAIRIELDTAPSARRQKRQS